MPIITCQEPYCFEQIKYTDKDTTVPLYCKKHRTKEGRHSQVKILQKPTDPKPKPKMVIMRCSVKSCGKREKMLWGDLWDKDKIPLCCGKPMLYHRDAKEGE